MIRQASLLQVCDCQVTRVAGLSATFSQTNCPKAAEHWTAERTNCASHIVRVSSNLTR